MVAGGRGEGHRILQPSFSIQAEWGSHSAEEGGCLRAGSQLADQEKMCFSRGASFQGVSFKKAWNAVGTAFEVFGQETGPQ